MACFMFYRGKLAGRGTLLVTPGFGHSNAFISFCDNMSLQNIENWQPRKENEVFLLTEEILRHPNTASLKGLV